jgi:hypothetical protein
LKRFAQAHAIGHDAAVVIRDLLTSHTYRSKRCYITAFVKVDTGFALTSIEKLYSFHLMWPKLATQQWVNNHRNGVLVANVWIGSVDSRNRGRTIQDNRAIIVGVMQRPPYDRATDAKASTSRVYICDVVRVVVWGRVAEDTAGIVRDGHLEGLVE